MRMIKTLLCVCLLFTHTASADDISKEELERWFNSDELLPPSYSVANVNEGQLQFLAVPPQKRFHHHHNFLTINSESLVSGWIKIEQCHYNLDRVPRTQILFHRDRVRNIRISKVENIEKAWVKDNSVQMANITDNAVICVEAISRALRANGDGSYSLSSGPFMRRFLDGYYPLRVTIDIALAGTGLKLESISPAQQDGFKVEQGGEMIKLDALFEGRLKTEMRLR